jgi:hypothetical protein
MSIWSHKHLDPYERRAIYDAGENTWLGATVLKQSFEGISVSHICKKHVILITWISQTKSMKVGTILPNDRRSGCEPLTVGIEMISLAEKSLIAFYQLLRLDRLGYQCHTTNNRKHYHFAH